MDALRFRLGAMLEWAVAAMFLAATLAVGSLVVRQARLPHPTVAPSVARAAVTDVPAAVPDRAVSVPVLPFNDGKEIRVGDTVETVAARLGRTAESGRQEIDRGALGERLTRFYEYGGFRFIVVFEPFERHGAPRAAAIYLP